MSNPPDALVAAGYKARIEALERENARLKEEGRLLREACRVVRSAMSTYTTYVEGGKGWVNEFEALFRQALTDTGEDRAG